MGTDSADGGSGNGNGRFPYGEVWIEGEGPLQDPIGRLVILMLAEAVALRCSEIEIDVVEDCCPVHFVRGDERLERDAPPVRLFRPLKDRLARMCGQAAGDGQGTFTAALKKSQTGTKVDGEVSVSVVFGDASLRLTITDFKPMP